MSTVLSDDDAKRNIAANLSRLMDARGWNQVDLARAIKLPNEELETVQVRIYRYCNGLQQASAAALARMAEALGSTTDALLRTPKKSSKIPA